MLLIQCLGHTFIGPYFVVIHVVFYQIGAMNPSNYDLLKEFRLLLIKVSERLWELTCDLL